MARQMSVIRIEPACVVRSGIKISVNGGAYASASFAGPLFNGGGSIFAIGSEGGGKCVEWTDR
jgi:hypothetical protein